MTASTTPRYPHVPVQLTGQDGNVFAILGRVRRALAQAGVNDSEIRTFFNEATAARSYDEVLGIVMRWVDAS